METGVAAGWSSYAALKAIKKNGIGTLYSSDFPYFRFKNPEKLIGIIVPKELKNNWHLDIRGDTVALPNFAEKIDRIDFFHYDSDKAYSGRKFAFDLLEKKTKENTVIVMDDIQDDTFFKDYVSKNNIKNFFVFEFEGKYIGLIFNPSFEPAG